MTTWEDHRMCEHCGCRGVEPIAELMDEHLALLEIAGDVRRHLTAGDRAACARAVAELGLRLTRHVGREDRGVFAALRDQGDFVDAVEELETEHVTFDAALARLDPDAPDFDRAVVDLLDELSEHIDKENLGIFPVAVVTLGGAWVGDRRLRARRRAELPGRPPHRLRPTS